MRTHAWRIDGLRGLGLGLLLSSVLFVFSSRLEAFIGVLAGGAVGLALGVWRERRGRAGGRPAAAPRPMPPSAPPGRPGRLVHPRLAVRFGSLLAIGLLVFVSAWALGYWGLPEGLLRGRNAAAVLAGQAAAPSFVREWGRLLAVNLLMGSIIALANGLLRVNGLPLGYLIPLVWFGMYGLTLGTNSFAIPLPARMAPSLAVLGRSGLYELAAFTLAAAATSGLSRYTLRRLFVTSPEPVTEGRSSLAAPGVWAPLLAAGLLLAAANAWEAWQIVARAGG
ncbi:MAG: hypothetical protein IT318_14960 [Anaerolineales bacterium]|nr:hypothetical protein [Anaerolineales bacterium]